MVCTADVDALGNTETTSADVSARVHWLGGAEFDHAAEDYADFYDGSWNQEATVRDESGTAVTIAQDGGSTYDVWTGCEAEGTAGMDGSVSTAMGTASPGTARLNSTTANTGPLNADDSKDPQALENYVYGLSPVFVVRDADAHRVGWGWRHMPAGIGAGEQFRLLFVTFGATDAVSALDGPYHEFVRAEAAEAYNQRVIRETASGFSALVSTSGTGAVELADIGSTGVPIYWVASCGVANPLGCSAQGDKVADDYADFVDGEWDTEGVWHFSFGNWRNVDAEDSLHVFTGSAASGAIAAGETVGSDTVATALLGSGGPLLGGGALVAKTEPGRLFGLSPVYEAPSARASRRPGGFTVRRPDPKGGTVTLDWDAPTDTGGHRVIGLSGVLAAGGQGPVRDP